MYAKKVLESLSVICESAKKLAVDGLFVQCLDEAIEAYWKSTNLAEGKVIFSLHSSGDAIYEGIAENCSDSAKITVDIARVVEAEKAVAEQPAGVIDESKLRKFVAESEGWIDTLKQATNKSKSVLETIEMAGKAKELEIQDKKSKLLDKLLGIK